MIDFISPVLGFIWPVLVAIVAFIGLFAWGKSKQRAGRAEERARAREARDLASDEAARIRDTAATTPISKKRKETSKWEK